MKTWLLIVVLAAGTVLMKTIGPILAGGRQPPPALTRVIALIAPALISALVVAGTFTQGQHLVIDARAAGLAVGAIFVVPGACRRGPRARRDHLRSTATSDLTVEFVPGREWSVIAQLSD